MNRSRCYRNLFPLVFAYLVASGTLPALSAEIQLRGNRFTLPDGMEIERVATAPMVNRPICADFDEQGRLYVADSSGSNDDVKIQLEKLPHRIVRLEDTDGDGQFDKSVVFADRMMFPEGTLWHDGSLYVGAPPHIWKLTDTDDDGKADKREIWFDGKTLTHCGNDMHGPYLGPDGCFYWCKGAFAEQTYERPGRDPLVTRAAHIFRRHPAGGEIEAVMTGGMDNPVEVIFTPGGERIFTTTFLVHPAHGQRDGIIHAIYGGVYGKVHRVLDGHPRTGPIMPVLAHHGGASAPCGLARLETSQLGDEYQNNVLACSFNMHKIFRHALQPNGASFKTKDSDFLVCDNLDFYPTDVLEDADGSLLVIDTGGWYKMCCPTSQLSKPDILGAIYRVRRTGSHKVADPRGKRIKWSSLSNAGLIELLADTRFMVRNRARQMLGQRGVAAVGDLLKVLESSTDRQQRLHAVWSLTQIDDRQARDAVRVALSDRDETVRQAALHSISVHRDKNAESQLTVMLSRTSAPNRRAAAEALGRLGSAKAVPLLLAATADCNDRVLEHSLIYAVIEAGKSDPARTALSDPRTRVRSAALIALDQMSGGEIDISDIKPLLNSNDPILRETAWWIADHHPEFASELTDYFRQELSKTHDRDETTRLTQRLSRFTANESIQQMMTERLSNRQVPRATRIVILEAMKGSGLKQIPPSWSKPLSDQLAAPDAELVRTAVSVVHAFPDSNRNTVFVEHLARIASDDGLPTPVRFQALAAIPGPQRKVNSTDLQFLVKSLSVDQPVNVRSLAVDVLADTLLDSDGLMTVAAALADTGPMELRRLMEIFARTKDEQVGIKLVDSLQRCPAATSLPVEQLKQQLSGIGAAVVARAEPLLARIRRENREKIAKLETILKLVDKGDIRRGQEVFHSSKAVCINCHGMGYLGGRSGPDLTRIGKIRSERDLLESILFPNVSFVRSYEPTLIITTKGRVYSGVVRDETPDEVVLQVDAEKVIRIALEEIDERHPGKVSIMPAGLDKHFSDQQLADLIKFLKASK